MSEIYFISDMHIGHKNILAYDNRPFDTVEDMNATLMENWNSRVNDDDEVYILGDISWLNNKATAEYYASLKGIKHLITGNHDSRLVRNAEVQKCFSSIEEYKQLGNIILCHYPIPCFKNHYDGWYHLYGHVHNGWEWSMMENTRRQMEELYKTPCNMINVGCMMPWMKYTPRTLEEITDGYATWRKANE